jgi:chromosome segregation protein
MGDSLGEPVHLKTLSLVGFKSFADRTRLVFEPGVTVVVGPNGTGKSNIVDAIAWVMGTQAASALRSDRMEDVIFAGTALRQATGRAEVALTFDNESRRLPLDLPEITVTRRLHRDGTSDYEINGTPCRLLDIQELLSDGGIGRHQHTIVGQGRVEGVLNAGPEEHRAVIEEAAGVIKHRQRRDRALRRLEATDVDVQRLEDLLAEQQRRMRPLRRQARAAERYDEAKAEWRALRLWLGGERLREIRDRLERLGSEQAAAEEIAEDAATRLESIDATLGELTGAAGDMGKALDRDTAAAARLETTLERLQRIAMVARERGGNLRRRVEGLERRRHDLEIEAAEIAQDLERSGEEARGLRSRLERHDVSLRALEDEERSLADEHSLPTEGVTARLRGELAALEAAHRRDDREVAETRRRLAVVEERLAGDVDEAEDLNERIRIADSGVDDVRRRYDAAAAHREEVQGTLAAAEERAVAARTSLAAADARLDVVLGARGEPDRLADLEGAIGPILQIVSVPNELVAAVHAALGPWSGAAVLAGLETLESAASIIGSGAVVAADAPAPEVVGSALIDHLDPGPHRRLVEALLGDVALAATWQEGLVLVRSGAAPRAVTPAGDLITPFGIRLAGEPETPEAAQALADGARAEAARATSRLTVARRAFEDAREAERASLEDLEAIETRISGAAEALRLVERSRSESEAERARLGTRLSALEEIAVGRSERVGDLRRRLDAFEGEEADRQAAWDAATARRSEIVARLDDVRRGREAAAAALAAVEERLRLLEQRGSEVHLTRQNLSVEQVDPGPVERLGIIEARARSAHALVQGHLGILRQRQRELRSSAGAAGARLESAHAERDRLSSAITEARERIAGNAVEIAELRVRNEAEEEGLRRDVDAEAEEALAALPSDLPDGVDGWEHAASLEARIKRLGPVNPLAAAEYRELAERAEFLEEQLADLASSRSELGKVITALDDEIGRLFGEAFAEISTRFEENFSLLFPGGSGRLSLTDPDDVLATGVQIHAQPMGKKIGKLSLLSGGERSLAALAFLFAVFRARPSPFYLLDEVEAALDDANLHRFIRLISTLRDSSQLVVVTHQQQTMEAADLLYGVTMEPGESSRVLAKRLTPAGLESA